MDNRMATVVPVFLLQKT